MMLERDSEKNIDPEKDISCTSSQLFPVSAKLKPTSVTFPLAGTGSSQHCVYLHHPISRILITHYEKLKKKRKKK